MLDFLTFVPFILKCFIVFALFWVMLYKYVIKENFLLKPPLFNKACPRITLINLPIQTPFNCFYYKGKKLQCFKNIKKFSDFCSFLEKNFILLNNSYCYGNVDYLNLFFKEIGVSGVDSVVGRHWYWPGIEDKSGRDYRDDYCNFSSSKFAYFYYNYCLNCDVYLSVFLLQKSLQIRDSERLARAVTDQGLQCIDLFHNCLVRNKRDILQIWYALTAILDLNLHPDSQRYQFLLSKLVIQLTCEILVDSSLKLSLLENTYLFFYVLKKQWQTFIQRTWFLRKCQKNLRYLSLIVLTVLLFFVYNTKYSQFASTILFIIILFFCCKKSLNYVSNIIHFKYKKKEVFTFKIFINIYLLPILLTCFNLVLLSFSIFVLENFKPNFIDISITFLCFVLCYCINLSLKYIYNKIINK